MSFGEGVVFLRNTRPQTYFLSLVTGHLRVWPSHISCLGGAIMYVARRIFVRCYLVELSFVFLAVLTTQIFVVRTISYVKC